MRRAAWIAACALLLAGGPAAAAPRVYVRAGALHMRPIVSSGEVELVNVSDYAGLAVTGGPIAGSGSTIAPVTIPALIIGYVPRFGHGHLALETVLGPPLTLHLRATGTLANESIAPTVLGDLPTGVAALGPKLGTTKAMPPMVTATYRFRPDEVIDPYVGGGLSYMHLYGGKVSNPMLTAVNQPSLETRDSVALVAQGGVAARLTGRYYATLDVKLLATYIPATVHDISVRTPDLPLFESARVGDASVSAFMMPVVLFLGAGANF